MGGRGAGGEGRAAGISVTILSAWDMVSLREDGYSKEVDEVLSVARDYKTKYGSVIDNLVVAEIKESNVTAFYGGGAVGFNHKSFRSKRANDAYDDCAKTNWHPSRGKKTGIQATAAHEYGHQITDLAAKKYGLTLDEMATKVVRDASKESGHGQGIVKMANKISRYASSSNAEAIAEAMADVYCNGRRAKPESRAVVNNLDKYYFKR